MFWRPTPSSLAFGAQYRYLGLPAIENYRLVKVYCENIEFSTTAPKVYITNKVAESATAAGAVNNDSADVVSGGEYQMWAAAGGGKYTYNLTGTEVNTVYYIYAQAKGAVTRIDLTYDK